MKNWVEYRRIHCSSKYIWNEFFTSFEWKERNDWAAGEIEEAGWWLKEEEEKKKRRKKERKGGGGEGFQYISRDEATDAEEDELEDALPPVFAEGEEDAWNPIEQLSDLVK